MLTSVVVVGCVEEGDVGLPPEGGEAVSTRTQAVSLLPRLPFPAGTTMGVSQGWNGAYSHTGNLQYAIDFSQAGSSDRGIHVLAVADGTVTYKEETCTCEGCTCNGGWGNAIVVDHGGGDFSKYTHLGPDSVPAGIDVGTRVCRGQHIGDLASTGNSTGPHLHFQFQSGGALNSPSVSFERFEETSGVPGEGSSNTSINTEVAGCGPPPACEVRVAASGETIIDDRTNCFSKACRTGSWWWEVGSGYADHHWFTYTTNDASVDCYGSWEVQVDQGGQYEVAVFVPNNADALTSRATYRVHGNGADHTQTVDQAVRRGQWVVLGTWEFASGGGQWVRLEDNTGEAYVNNSGPRLTFDAVRFSPPAPTCSDECAAGAVRCEGNQTRSCGNYDEDSCLEWGGGADCGADRCVAGRCEANGPDCPSDADCGGRSCGADPICGAPCGACIGDQLCTADGQCVDRDPGCEDLCPSVGAEACGDGNLVLRCAPADGGCLDWTVAQSCLDGQHCTGAGVCEATPAACPEISDCSGRRCGPDPVCGVECGVCAEGASCVGGLCQAPSDGDPDDGGLNNGGANNGGATNGAAPGGVISSTGCGCTVPGRAPVGRGWLVGALALLGLAWTRR